MYLIKLLFNNVCKSYSKIQSEKGNDKVITAIIAVRDRDSRSKPDTYFFVFL